MPPDQASAVNEKIAKTNGALPIPASAALRVPVENRTQATMHGGSTG
jgi:hypothetical protein